MIGFCAKEGKYRMKSIIKKGDKYNRLTAIKFSHKNEHGSQFWTFKCTCGNLITTIVSGVKNEGTKSCGCFTKDRIYQHGMIKTKVYSCWHSMKDRCLNKDNQNYKNYGSRGIKVCKEWMEFKNFYKDMGDAPKNKSLDRVNNNKGYYKSNCRWSTRTEQQNNTRKNIFLTYRNETKTVSQWAVKLNINKYTIFTRLRRNFSIEKALTK